MEVKHKRNHPSIIKIDYKRLRRLKTDAEGKIQLPRLKWGSYQVQLAHAAKYTIGWFEIPDNWQPVECTQRLVAEDKGDHVDMHLAVAAETANRN